MRPHTTVQSEPKRADIKFTGSVDTALKSIDKGDKLALIYFCSQDEDKYVGEGNGAAKEYQQKCRRPAAWTVLDDPVCVKTLQENGVGAFVKVPCTKENAEVYQKFGVTSTGTMLLCTAAGNSCWRITPGDRRTDYAKLMEAAKKRAPQVDEAAKKAGEAKKKADEPKKTDPPK